MKTLFVGGPKDGKREDWDWGRSGPIAQVATYNVFHGPVVPIDQGTIGMDIHTYQLKQFRQNGTDYEVAFHSSVTDPMKALITGYHYHRKPRYGRPRRIPQIP